MDSFTEIIVQASKLGTVDEMREFMYEQAGQLYKDDADVDNEFIENLINESLKYMVPEQFDDDEAAELLSAIEVPEKKNDRFATAANFAKEYLTKYETRDTSLFIRMELKTYFSLSIAECDLIIQKIEKDRAKLGLKSKDEIASMISALDKPTSVEIEDNVNSEVKENWSEYALPKPNKGTYKIDETGITRVFPVIEKFINENGERDTREVEKSVVVCRSPFVVCGKSISEDEKHTLYKLRYTESTGTAVKEAWIYHSDMMSKTALNKALGALKINCPDNELLVETLEYVSTSLSQFGTKLKSEASSDRCGWNKAKTRFMFGKKVYTANGVESAVPVGNATFEALGTKGSLKGWIGATRNVIYQDVTRFKIYDVFTAPILYLLDCEGHVIDHYFSTSNGKTLTSRVSVSMYGCPEDNGLVLPASSTSKGLLIDVKKYSDLAIVFDESSKAKADFPDVIYAVANGRDRVRSTKGGEQIGGEAYRSVVHITGEHCMRDSFSNAGEMVRTIELRAALDQMLPEEADDVKRGISSNYGHFMDMFMEKVFRMKDDGSLENLYKKCFDKLPKTSSNIEGRSKSVFAVIMTAGYIVEKMFTDVGIEAKDPETVVNKYFCECIFDKPIEVEYIRALRLIHDTTITEYKNFALCVGDTVSENDGKERYGYIDDNYIDFVGSTFNTILTKNGFKPTKIKEDLEERGIIAPRDKKGQTRVRRCGEQMSVIRFYKEKINEVLGLVDRSGVEDVPMTKDVVNTINTVNLLSDIRGKADLSLIKQIIPDTFGLESMLEILVKNDKIVKLNETTYKRAN